MASTTFRCPNCNKESSTMMPPKSGNYDIICPQCKKTVNVHLTGAEEGGGAAAAPRGPLSVQERMRMRRQGVRPGAAAPATPAAPEAPAPAPAPKPEPAPAPAVTPAPAPVPDSSMPDVYAALGGSSLRPAAAPVQEPAFGTPNPYAQPNPYGPQVNPYAQPSGYQQPQSPYGAQPQNPYNQPQQPAMNVTVGKLMVVGSPHMVYQLKQGSNIVGRADAKKPSDISISNDSYMSRRSVEVLVTNTGMGFSYELRVLACTNPVLLNNQEVRIGECRPLLPFDEFVLGNTRFRLE